MDNSVNNNSPKIKPKSIKEFLKIGKLSDSTKITLVILGFLLSYIFGYMVGGIGRNQVAVSKSPDVQKVSKSETASVKSLEPPSGVTYSDYKPPRHPAFYWDWKAKLGDNQNFIFLYPPRCDVTSDSTDIYDPIVLQSSDLNSQQMVQRIKEM